jgi:hypothetical protein
MYEQVDTGPIYDELVQWMGTYRSLQSRMFGAKHSTQKKIDNTLEGLGERIDERITELSEQERSALDCWQEGIISGVYEMDREALMEKPYRSIRLIVRWDDENDTHEMTAAEQQQDDPTQVEKAKQQLAAFLNIDSGI